MISFNRTRQNERSFTLPFVLLSGVAKVHGLSETFGQNNIQYDVLLGSSLDFETVKMYQTCALSTTPQH